jgi:hypothetical protein
MQEKNRKNHRLIWLSSAAALVLAAGLWLLSGDAFPSNAADARQPDRVAAGAKLAQTIEYVRCGHQVLRRIDAPAGWAGMDVDAVQQALEPGWRLISFAPQTLEMTCALEMFCPAHWVLMLDADGEAAIFQNEYGFEMVRQSDANFRPREESIRAKLVRGLSFDTLADLQEWMDMTD